MGAALANLAMTAGSAVAGPIANQIGYGLGELTGYNKAIAEDQIEQQQKLTDIQSEANLGLMKESYKEQKNLWDATQAEAQVAHLKAAGLNPAIIYAHGGAGGSTSGGGGASVSGGQASDEASRKQAQNAQTATGLALMKMQSEIQVNEATANKLNTEADVQGKEGRGKLAADTAVANATVNEITEKINNLKAETELKGQETELNKLQQNATEIANSFNETNNVTLLKENIQILKKISAEANVAEATQESLIQTAKENVKLTISQTLLNNKTTDLKQQEIFETINHLVLDRISTMSQVTRQQFETELQSSMQQLERDLRNKAIDQSEINTIISVLGTLGGALVIKGAFGPTSTKKSIGY